MYKYSIKKKKRVIYIIYYQFIHNNYTNYLYAIIAMFRGDKLKLNKGINLEFNLFSLKKNNLSNRI